MSTIEPSSIWVVIPAFNEASVIADVVRSVTKYGYQVVVVDDCSRDDTFGALAGTLAHRLRHPINLGQGASLQTGLTYALGQGAKFLVSFDADGQHQAQEIEALVRTLVEHNVDAALGSRFLSPSGSATMPEGRRTLLKTATAFTRLTTGLKLTDTHNGFRAFTRDAAQKLDITQNRMAHASQILSQIASLKLRYREVPVTIAYTEYSLAKGQRATNAFNILWESLMGRLFQ